MDCLTSHTLSPSGSMGPGPGPGLGPGARGLGALYHQVARAAQILKLLFKKERNPVSSNLTELVGSRRIRFRLR